MITGSMSFSGSGGGRGGHTSYAYQFAGSLSGTITSGGVTQAANGSVSQYVKTSGQIGAGSAPITSGFLGWNSAYSPLILGDAANSRILVVDNVAGANLGSYGSAGTGVGNFGTVAGLALDSAGRIYIADSALNRLVRIDNGGGTNWTEFGSSGSGINQFNQPHGLAVDAAGRIWIADTSNNRIVRIDDLTGKNWVSFGSLGSGINQFNAPLGLAFDIVGRIYVADSGNGRLVRIDNLGGANWTTLSQLNIDPYGYPLTNLSGIAVAPQGRVFLTDGNYLLGMDDITGTNGSAISLNGPLSGISVDKAGTLYLVSSAAPQLAQVVNGNGAGFFGSSLGLLSYSPSAVAARPAPSQAAVPALSVAALSFGNGNVGEPGPAQQLQLTNLGSGPMAVSSITIAPDFKLSDNCPLVLTGGLSCTLAVQFDPVATGQRTGTLTIATKSVHSVRSVSLSGNGQMPRAVISPEGLTFDPQLTGTASSSQIVTLSNPGSGPLTIAQIQSSGDFAQTTNCPSVLAAGNGCTLSVSFKPTAAGLRNGDLVILDDAVPGGTKQTVSLQGTGSSTAASFIASPESLFFPDQQVSVSSGAQSLTLTNHSGASVSLAAPVYSGPFKGTSTCGSTLSSGSSCAFK